jgi:putative DNA primase/helicase
MSNALALSEALSARAGDIAQRLLGDPNRAASSRRELRFGNRGSLAVITAGPKRGYWYDYEQQQGGDLLELIRREQRCSFPEALEIAQDLTGISPARLPDRARKEPEPETDTQRSRRALAIWQESERLDDSPALTYLRSRGIRVSNLSCKIRDALRWHPHCPWDGSRHGCMVALWTDAITAEPRAIHRTAIAPDGTKIGRKSFGPSAGCVIRLWADREITTGLVIGEGIETTAAAATRITHRGTLLQPAWACGDAGHLRQFPVLPGIEALTILVDHDANDAGQTAGMECRDRWLAAGREVTRFTPDHCGDFNDITKEGTRP